MAEMVLPTGRRGQLLAVAIAGVAACVVWFGLVAPLADWHDARAERLEQLRARATRMDALAASLPGLRRQVATLSSGPAPQSLLEGASDAVAGAALQEQVQAMAVEAGTPLTSAEALPAEPAGSYRRIGLRVSVAASYPVLANLLAAIDGATPRMLVDYLQIEAPPLGLRTTQLPMDATLTVLAFRARDPAPAPEAARADAGGADAGQSDAGRSDAGRTDAGQADAAHEAGAQDDAGRAR